MTAPENVEAHRAQHREWHAALEPLLNDYLAHHKGALLAHITAAQLERWSHAQTVQPEELHK